MIPLDYAITQINRHFKKVCEELWNNNDDKPGYCEIGMDRCISCGWQGSYPVSGCPLCKRSFVE